MMGLAASLVLSCCLLGRSAFSFVPTTIVPTQGQRHALAQSTGASKERESKLALNAKSRINVLVCPAQFCVPDDYDCLFDILPGAIGDDIEVGTCVTAPLPRTEWIKVAKQLPTAAFWKAELDVKTTLGWYFDAMDAGLAEIYAREGENAKICIIGHSIGGWVARAYLGGLSGSSLRPGSITSLVTLGSPHISPETALVDQTRGLLAAVEASAACKPMALLGEKSIQITCVCSNAVQGKIFTTNVEEFVAATSYYPLTGSYDGVGDGIVPFELAYLEDPAQRVIVETCDLTAEPIRHSHVVPTPWNLLDGYAPSIQLPNFPSYVSEGVVEQWAEHVR